LADDFARPEEFTHETCGLACGKWKTFNVALDKVGRWNSAILEKLWTEFDISSMRQPDQLPFARPLTLWRPSGAFPFFNNLRAKSA
jgi:hypothetical protein